MNLKRKSSLKKVVALLLVMQLLLTGFPGAMKAENAGNQQSFVWLEAENYKSVSADGYYVSEEAHASNGSLLKLQTTTPNTVALASYEFNIAVSKEYDIWVLSTVRNEWLSDYNWQLNDEGYSRPLASVGESVFQSEGMPFYWHKLSSVTLDSGSHSLQFKTDEMRQGAHDVYMQGLDAIAIVPTAWEWIPNDLEQPEAPPVTVETNYLWTEAEAYSSVSGGYHTAEESQASGGNYLKLQTYEPGTVATVKYDITVPETDNYEIWSLSTVRNEYLSDYSWKLNDGAYQSPPAPFGESLYISAGMPFYWYKLSSTELSQGTHSIQFKTDSHRQAIGDNLYIQAIDAIAVVPKSWNWQPYGLNKPFDVAGASLEFVSASIENEEIDREDTVKLTVTNRSTKVFNGKLTYFAELMYKGEVVSRGEKVITKETWAAGDTGTEELQFTVPFNAPRGLYEVRTGIVNAIYADGSATAKVSDIQVGDDQQIVAALEAKVTSLTLPSVIAAGTNVSGSAQFELKQAVDFDTTGHVSLYRGDVLWYVGELEGVTTSEVAANVPQTVQFSIKLPEGIPSGNYTAEFGLHKLAAVDQPVVNIQVTNGNEKLGYKPLTYGRFVDGVLGQTHLWYANQAHTMIWDGVPFIPVGGMFTSDYIIFYSHTDPEINRTNWENDLKILQYMELHGVKDLYLNAARLTTPTWAWQYLLDYFEEHGFRYGLQVDSIKGTAVENVLPAYRIRAHDQAGSLKVEQVTGNRAVDLTVQTSSVGGFVSADSALYVAIDSLTGEIIQSGEAPVTNESVGSFTVRANITEADPEDTFTVYFTPQVSYMSHTLKNIWDAGDLIIDNVQKALGNVTLGPQFRLFVDVINNESGIVNQDESMIIDSPIYRSQFADWLENKYSTIAALNTAWKMENPIASFELAARLIPVVRGEEQSTWGRSLLLVDSANPGHNYKANSYTGVLWDDFVDFRELSYNEYLMKISDGITSVVDAPIVFKHTGTTRKYFVNNRQNGGFHGVGGEIYGHNEYYVRERSGYTYNNIEEAAQTMWFITTETQLDEDMNRKHQSGVKGYPDKETMHGHFDTLLEGGSKGIYDFLFNCSWYETCRETYAYYTAKPVQFDWLKEYRDELLVAERVESILDYRPKVYYMYPAGEMWWMANRRNVVLPGNDYRGGATLETHNNEWVVPTYDPNIKTDVLVVNMEDDPSTSVYGPKLIAQGSLKNRDKHIVYMGYRQNLGALPEIDQYFTNEFVQLADGSKVQVLDPSVSPTAEVLYKTDDNKVWALRDGKLWIIAAADFIQPFNAHEPKGNIKYLDKLDFTAVDPGNPGTGNPDNNGNPGNYGAVTGQKEEPKLTFENGMAVIQLSNDVTIPLSRIKDAGLRVIAGESEITITKEQWAAWSNSSPDADIAISVQKGDESLSQSFAVEKGVDVRLAGPGQQVSIELVDKKGTRTPLTFDAKGVTITLPISVIDTDQELLGVYRYDEKGKRWIYVGGVVDKVSSKITASVDASGIFAVIEYRQKFNDVPVKHWAFRMLQSLAAQHIVLGAGDALFEPQKHTSRAEFTALLARALKLTASSAQSGFADVNDEAWYASSVQAAVEAGLMRGIGENRFAPDQQITRAEIAVIISRALGIAADSGLADSKVSFGDEASIPQWARTHIAALHKAGIVQGRADGKFYPLETATRVEAAAFIWKMLQH